MSKLPIVAAVRRVTGATRHTFLTTEGMQDFPHPTRVKILRDEHGSGGFFLFRLDSTGMCMADSWHSSVDEAQKQAYLEYQIELDDWQVEPDP